MSAAIVRQAALLLGAALIAWIVTLNRISGMDMAPGTNLGGLGWFVGIWVTMMAAMMLPSVAPMVLLFDRVSAERARRGRPFVRTWMFAATYLGVWTAYGVAAYGVYRGIRAFDLGILAWDRGGPYVTGAALVAAGVYESTPLKAVCLRHCRSPMHFVLRGWREGLGGAIRMGVEHGAYCVGCCWGLMLVLFALGVMSLFWMAVVGALIFAQKVLPYGDRLTRGFAFAFVAVGIWVAAAPNTVPGLQEPGSVPGAKMRMGR